MVELFTREQEAEIAKVRHYYDELSEEAKAAFHDGLDTMTIHPALTIGVVFALGFCIGVLT